MTKEQLIKEFREKFGEKAGRSTTYYKDLEAFILSAFDAGRASGIEEGAKSITCTQDIDGGVCDCCQANHDRIAALTPSSSKDN